MLIFSTAFFLKMLFKLILFKEILIEIVLKISIFLFVLQVLVCADGAPSKLATELGLVTRPPDSTCSRAFVEGGTHRFNADGVVFYNKEMLPGNWL